MVSKWGLAGSLRADSWGDKNGTFRKPLPDGERKPPPIGTPLHLAQFVGGNLPSCN